MELPIPLNEEMGRKPFASSKSSAKRGKKGKKRIQKVSCPDRKETGPRNSYATKKRREEDSRHPLNRRGGKKKILQKLMRGRRGHICFPGQKKKGEKRRGRDLN